MGTRVLKLMGTVMLLAWPMRAAADPISIIAATRRLAVLAKVTDANGSDRHTLIQEQGDALTAATSATTGSSNASSVATLVSNISDPTHFTGRATADVTFATIGSADLSASSDFAVDFRLEESQSFMFGSTFVGSGQHDTGSTISRASWTASLSSGWTTVFNDVSSDSAIVRKTGVLLPGNYHLLVEAAALRLTFPPTLPPASGAEGATFDFTFDLAPVAVAATPEPATLTLVGTAALGIIGTTRRRRRSESAEIGRATNP